jgi:glycine C-acetyltransferase
MPVNRLTPLLEDALAALEKSGTRKGRETITTGVIPAEADRGPRFTLEGEGERPFLRMNSNGYLGLALLPELIAAEEQAARTFGTGPGAVRFISGTFAPHVELERQLAEFHDRARSGSTRTWTCRSCAAPWSARPARVGVRSS